MPRFLHGKYSTEDFGADEKRQRLKSKSLRHRTQPRKRPFQDTDQENTTFYLLDSRNNTKNNFNPKMKPKTQMN